MTGIADLTGIGLKLDRAKEHLKTLKTELNIYSEKHANLRIIQIEREGAWHVVKVGPLPESDVRRSIVAGDLIYNLRSALDQLVWQLVLRDGEKPSGRNEFPILDSKEQWLDEVRYRLPPGNQPLSGITIDGDAWTIIENAQPYKTPEPKTHLLSIVRRLSNLDKHRTLYEQMAFAGLDTLEDAIGWNPDAVLLKQVRIPGPLSPDKPTQVWRLRFAADPEPGVYVKGRLAITPTLGEGDHEGAVQLGVSGGLKLLIDHVEVIVIACRQLPRIIV